ncbi:MAG: hypothetical protein ACK56I_05035, partial [bacterium]
MRASKAVIRKIHFITRTMTQAQAASQTKRPRCCQRGRVNQGLSVCERPGLAGEAKSEAEPAARATVIRIAVGRRAAVLIAVTVNRARAAHRAAAGLALRHPLAHRLAAVIVADDLIHGVNRSAAGQVAHDARVARRLAIRPRLG